MIFNKGFIFLTALLCAGLITAALTRPPMGAAGTMGGAMAAPRVSATLPEVPENDWSADRTAAFETAAGPFVPATVNHLDGTFRLIAFDLGAVAAKGEHVPRVFVASLPQDLKDIRDVPKRKALFFKTMLPLVLKVNEDIQAERARLWSMKAVLANKGKISALDRLWLIVMAERYKVARTTPVRMINALLPRVDVIPPSLALAQAAEESGWGTSRFVREGNALFGEWTWSGKGIVPKGRDEGKTHRIRAFDSLLESVRSYALNINTHRAYRDLRQDRAEQRADGKVLDGWLLARHLESYSQRGLDYVEGLRAIMETNGLDDLDTAKLALGV